MARISELFLSIQGEGPSAGTPAQFLRLQGCDVGCHWCDTRYSWRAEGGEARELGDLFRALDQLGPAPLLVVTGGEPCEAPDLGELLDRALERWPRIEVETSGLLPPPRSHPRLGYNVSPKLPSATPRWAETWAHAGAWLEEPGATFKIVVGDDPDPADALSLIAEHGLPASRVMLMPQGMTEAELRPRAARLAEICKRHGFRLSPRLHVWLWGARRGV
ncbi:MAG TPA: 7-carboxy-7-deazaguanine synthase QueE [Candidatus Udaeobacter sp.]|jgi:7-carboxy-7-deazaguanine synthase|nr:7-carboxy-7-deazaguanine synthase QueE [Candidatus Udaeobacter sp.]